MSVYVVDASVAVKWFLPENHTDFAFRVLDKANELHAPDLLFLEVDNVLCKRSRRGEISPFDAERVRVALRQMPIRIHTFMPLLDTAFHIAQTTRRGLYDSLYVALGVLLDAQVVTADMRLYNALATGTFSSHIMWIEDVT